MTDGTDLFVTFFLFTEMISRERAYKWFKFFAELPEDEELMNEHYEIIYEVFARIESAAVKKQNSLMSEIPNLKSLDGRTYYVGPDEKFPKGCKSCLTGSGLSAVRKTNKCNLKCKFCYDYGCLNEIPAIGEKMWEIGGTKYHEDDIDLLMQIQQKPTGIAYVYLEPFCEIEKYYKVIEKFAKAGVHQHLYTNGTLATEENLKALGNAGLDELRFNLGATDASDIVIEAMATAKKYIPQVGIETPMTPQFYDRFIEKQGIIKQTGIDFMNCAELHLNLNNVENYFGEKMYIYRHGYVSPVSSRELTLKLMKQAAEENWDLVVHDCSNRTKFAREMNLKAHEGGWFGASNYGFEFDEILFEIFLPILEDDEYYDEE